MKIRTIPRIAALSLMFSALLWPGYAADPTEIPLAEKTPNLKVWGAGKIKETFPEDGGIHIDWEVPDTKKGAVNFTYEFATPISASTMTFDLKRSQPEGMVVVVALEGGKIFSVKAEVVGEDWQTFTFDLHDLIRGEGMEPEPIAKVKISTSSSNLGGTQTVGLRRWRLE